MLKNKNYTFNELQLKILANSSGFVTISGGSAILELLFKKPTVIYATCNRETLPEYWEKDAYYQVISNQNAIPVIYKNDDIYKRGYQDYNLLLKTIEKTFNKMEGK